MPALVLFGHRTALSGDDLRIFSFIAILFRVFQLALVISVAPYTLGVKRSLCPRERRNIVVEHVDVLMHCYWALSFLECLLAIPIEALICKTSQQGTPVEPEKRSRLKLLCSIKIVGLSLLSIAAVVFGIITVDTIRDYCVGCNHQDEPYTDPSLLLASQEICPGFDSLFWLLRALLVVQLIVVSVALFLYVYFVFQWLKPRKNLSRLLMINPSSGSGWRFCCRLCCTCTSLLTCCLLGGLSGALMNDFVDISVALEGFFGTYVSVSLFCGWHEIAAADSTTPCYWCVSLFR